MKNQTVRILAGRIFFHSNPKLCYETIEELKPFLSKDDKFSAIDVSTHTNGERVVCKFEENFFIFQISFNTKNKNIFFCLFFFFKVNHI